MENQDKSQDQRDNVRLSQVLAAKFMLIDEEKAMKITKMQYGFVRNISAGGALLEIDDFNSEWTQWLDSQVIKVLLEIEVPEVENPIRLLARTAWFSKISGSEGSQLIKCVLGLKFLDITTAGQDIIKEYVMRTYSG